MSNAIMLVIFNFPVIFSFEVIFIFLIIQRDLTPPYVDDGLLEVVGFRDAWHGLVLLAPKGHGTRLAQVCVRW